MATDLKPQVVDGVLHLYIDVSVSLKEMAGWPPTRIQRYLAGMAQAIEASIGEHDGQEEEAAQEADREPEEETGEVKEEISSPQEWGCDT